MSPVVWIVIVAVVVLAILAATKLAFPSPDHPKAGRFARMTGKAPGGAATTSDRLDLARWEDDGGHARGGKPNAV